MVRASCTVIIVILFLQLISSRTPFRAGYKNSNFRDLTKQMGSREQFGKNHYLSMFDNRTSGRINPMTDIREKVISCREITEFQKKVFLELLKVPAGQTISYGELARRIGCRCPQAVGQALRKNPFAPDVPCHRVIRSDGKIGGYFGKTDGDMIERKRKLLESEQ